MKNRCELKVLLKCQIPNPVVTACFLLPLPCADLDAAVQLQLGGYALIAKLVTFNVFSFGWEKSFVQLHLNECNAGRVAGRFLRPNFAF